MAIIDSTELRHRSWQVALNDRLKPLLRTMDKNKQPVTVFFSTYDMKSMDEIFMARIWVGRGALLTTPPFTSPTELLDYIAVVVRMHYATTQT